MTIDVSVPVRIPRKSMTDEQRARLLEKQKAKRAARDAAGFSSGPVPPAIMTPGQAAMYLTVSVSWLACRRIEGNGPPYIQITGHKIGYRLRDLDAYVESRVTTKTTRTHLRRDIGDRG